MNLPIVQAAVRVLADLMNYRHPDPGDLVLLRQQAGASAPADPDALACEIIHRELARRAEVEREQQRGSQDSRAAAV